MFAGRKVVFQGRTWCSVADAARYLRTNVQKVKSMMDTELEYTQVRANGNLYVLLDDVVKVQIAKVYGPNGKPKSGP